MTSEARSQKALQLWLWARDLLSLGEASCHAVRTLKKLNADDTETKLAKRQHQLASHVTEPQEGPSGPVKPLSEAPLGDT